MLRTITGILTFALLGLVVALSGSWAGFNFVAIYWGYVQFLGLAVLLIITIFIAAATFDFSGDNDGPRAALIYVISTIKNIPNAIRNEP